MTGRASAHHEHVNVEQVGLVRIRGREVLGSGFVDEAGRSEDGCSGDLVFEVFATIHGDGLVRRLEFQKDAIDPQLLFGHEGLKS